MTKSNKTGLLLFPVFCIVAFIFLHTIIEVDRKARNYTVKETIHDSMFPRTMSGNLIVGGRELSEKDFVKITEFAFANIVPKYEKQIEKLTNTKIVEVESIIEKIVKVEVPRTRHVVTDIYDFDMFLEDIIGIYYKERYRAKKLLRIYQRKKNDKEFMDNVDEFIEDNQ